MRTWMTETETPSGRIVIDMPGYLPVTIYADTTQQYTEEEIEELQDSSWGQMMEIPVPEDLLFQWWIDDLDSNELHWDKYKYESTYKEFKRWFNEESTADDCDTLYGWLKNHNYNWKRLD